jgi:hypothetical protein
MSLGSVPPPSPRMSVFPFCPRQRWRTFFPDLWEQMLSQSSRCFLSHLCPPLPPQACPYCDPTFPWGLCSLSFFDFLLHLLFHPSWPKSHDCVIREEPKEFGSTMVAWHLLWACVGECPWEEEGRPFYPFKYNVPFRGPPVYTSPEKRRLVISPLPSCTEPLWWSVHLFIESYLNCLASFGGTVSNA